MLQKWFKFTAIGCKERYGFGTIAEAVEFAATVSSDRAAPDCTPYLLSNKQVVALDLANRSDAFILREECLSLSNKRVRA